VGGFSGHDCTVDPTTTSTTLLAASTSPSTAVSSAVTSKSELSSDDGSVDADDACDPSPCLNDGVCGAPTFPASGSGEAEVASNTTFECTCPRGFGGQYCELEGCDASPCANGAKCFPGLPGSGESNSWDFTCGTCPGPWVGSDSKSTCALKAMVGA
jgi:hypothetical protein